MRVTFFLKFKEFPGKIMIPPDYRIKIYSLIKELIKQDNPGLRDRLWGTDKKVNCVKPFTFTCYFPKVEATDEGIECTSDRFSLTVSFGNYIIPGFEINGYEVFFSLYNGLIKQKKNMILHLNGDSYMVSLSRALVQKENPVFQADGKIIFKTCGPLLIRKIQQNKKPEWLSYEDDEFHTWVEKSVTSLSGKFIKKTDFSVQCEPLECKTIYLNHYKGLVKATTGTFRFTALPEVIKLVYEVGMGAKRNEGFGMVEVVK